MNKLLNKNWKVLLIGVLPPWIIYGLSFVLYEPNTDADWEELIVSGKFFLFYLSFTLIIVLISLKKYMPNPQLKFISFFFILSPFVILPIFTALNTFKDYCFGTPCFQSNYVMHRPDVILDSTYRIHNSPTHGYIGNCHSYLTSSANNIILKGLVNIFGYPNSVYQEVFPSLSVMKNLNLDSTSILLNSDKFMFNSSYYWKPYPLLINNDTLFINVASHHPKAIRCCYYGKIENNFLFVGGYENDILKIIQIYDLQRNSLFYETNEWVPDY